MKDRIEKILTQNGDCCITVLDDIYKVLVRIDDSNYQILFAHKVKSVLDLVDEQLQENEEVDMNKIPRDVYRHFPVVCKEEYGMSDEEIANFSDFLEVGYATLADNTGLKIMDDEILVNVVTLSLFLEFRKTALGVEEFPKIQFALPPNKEKEKVINKEAKTMNEVLKKTIGQA